MRFSSPCPTPSTTFRHDIYPDYKGNRPASGRPIILRWLRRWAVENMDGKAIENLEADDVIGISATHPKWKKWRQVIITEDKDLQTIPGEVFFPKSDELLKVSPDEAELHFYCQALAGDVVDNFPGCPGIGMQGAQELLGGEEPVGIEPYEHTFKRGPRKGKTETRWKKTPMDTYWDAIVSHYERNDLTEEDAILQARLLHLQF